MSQALKDVYTPDFYRRFAGILQQVLPGFREKEFTRLIFSDGFENKELKDRMRHTSKVLHRFMPAGYEQAATSLQKIVDQLRRERFGEDSFPFLFLPDYIEQYGPGHFEPSMKAIEHVTGFVSCEFAVRPFLLQYGERMLQQMRAWAQHDNHKVRRLASEGCRPRLPWAMAVPMLKKDPEPVLAILELLKNDASEWVRRSVANNLNDIAKDHPHRVLQVAEAWRNISPETDAIIKHGCRTLLKQGHAEILKYYNLQFKGLRFDDFRLYTPEVQVGGALEFSFSVANKDRIARTVRIEYAVYYKRSKDSGGKKVFKISERTYQPGERMEIRRKQSFKPITTRRFYNGLHRVSVIINGQEQEIADFRLSGAE